MTTGVQAASLMLSKVGEPTVVNDCVHGLVTEIFNPLGVMVPQTSVISGFLVPPMKQVATPFVGCVARFPRALGYQHVCMITGISGDTLTETSFGTGNHKVRSANFPSSFFESFWTPPYDGATSNTNANVETASAVTTSTASFLPKTLTDKSTWVRVGIGTIGATLLLIAAVKLFSETSAGKSMAATASTVAKVAIAIPK